MHLGAFLMPSHPPERALLDGIRWDLAQLRRLDALGFAEAWIGEHFTAPWEPCPAPDLLIAQALLSTERIKLCPGAHLLPYHHPVELAHRVAYLDHLAQGRYMLGVGISALPSDFKTDPSEPDSAITVDYLIERSWLVGSPATVAEKLARLEKVTGGFGTLLVMMYDFADEAEEWDESLALLASEVVPRLAA